MKKYSFLIYISLLTLLFTSCIKEDEKRFVGGTVVEIDPAVFNTNVVNVGYPILTRIPVGNRPTQAPLDSILRRLNNKTITIRVNLVGPHSSKDETVGFTSFTTSPTATIAFTATGASGNTAIVQNPSRPAATLTLVDGIPGTHFNIATSGGFITIPANSSYGYIDLVILPSSATAGQARFVGFEINNTGTLKVNPNYSKVGLAIDQR